MTRSYATRLRKYSAKRIRREVEETARLKQPKWPRLAMTTRVSRHPQWS
jgi:hypothetical protein